MAAKAIDKTLGLQCDTPYFRVRLIPRALIRTALIPGALAAHLLMQIRHNLVVPEKPFFRRGRCVPKTAPHLEKDENTGFFGMKRSRIGLALFATALCTAALALAWPHARDAGAILAAQDDPAGLSDLQLNSALRNNFAVIADNIEAALAAGDADLAASFAELASEKKVALDEDLSRRVTE